MVIHKYSFFVEDDQVCVYSYNEEKREFKCETNQGEERFNISSDFWNWWVEAASFNKQNDCVDFCFIYDKNYDFINHNFNKADKSIWKSTTIEKLIKTKLEYSHIILKNQEESVTKNFDKENNIFADNSIRIFYTNIHLDNKKSDISEGDMEAEDSGEEISEFARYFINKSKQENSN